MQLHVEQRALEGAWKEASSSAEGSIAVSLHLTE